MEALVIVLVLASLMLLLRWIWAPSARPRPLTGPDYGLLAPVGGTRARDEAESLSRRLGDEGIRATLGPAPGDPDDSDKTVVLVFPSDRQRAMEVVSS